METQFTPWASLLGGMMIGLSAVAFMAFTGRIAGISGIVSRLLPPDGTVRTGLPFVIGLLAAAPLYFFATGGFPAQAVTGNTMLLVVAGLLVGFGATYGNGCTCGHGVCGISRLSTRSIIATITFMAAAAATVLVMRHGLGG
ncbi:MAG: YeeE/YedE thiosulfate transporter family protein [Pseudomonadota bacterium]